MVNKSYYTSLCPPSYVFSVCFVTYLRRRLSGLFISFVALSSFRGSAHAQEGVQELEGELGEAVNIANERERRTHPDNTRPFEEWWAWSLRPNTSSSTLIQLLNDALGVHNNRAAFARPAFRTPSFLAPFAIPGARVCSGERWRWIAEFSAVGRDPNTEGAAAVRLVPQGQLAMPYVPPYFGYLPQRLVASPIRSSTFLSLYSSSNNLGVAVHESALIDYTCNITLHTTRGGRDREGSGETALNAELAFSELHPRVAILLYTAVHIQTHIHASIRIFSWTMQKLGTFFVVHNERSLLLSA